MSLVCSDHFFSRRFIDCCRESLFVIDAYEFLYTIDSEGNAYRLDFLKFEQVIDGRVAVLTDSEALL